MAKLHTCIIFFLAAFVVECSHLMEWPLPTRLHMRHHGIHYRTHSRRYLTRVEHVNEAAQSFGFFHYFGECFRPFFGLPLPLLPSSPDPLISHDSSDDLADSPNHKLCEVCYRTVQISDCFSCCSNGHRLHLDCFKQILSSAHPVQRKCPLCRNQLISRPTKLLVELLNNDPEQHPELWNTLEGHFHILLSLKPTEMAQLNWDEALSTILAQGKPAHLRRFLELPQFIDVNAKFENGECAVSTLLIGISLHQAEELRVCRLRENLQIILNHPEIILNRWTGILPRHLIYEAVDCANFHVFLQILDASPDLNLAELFRYICNRPASPKLDVFFNFLLTCNLFDLFAPDEFNNSALHVAIKYGNTEYTLMLLNNEQCTTDHLMAADTRTRSTVLHTAMKKSQDCVIDKLISFRNIDWDLTDSSGQSISALYENRSFN